MNDSSASEVDPVERVMEMIREYYEDQEVMRAWGSADEEGQLPDEATRVIGQFDKRWRGDNPTPGGLIFEAGIAARQIAEGKFSSPDDPALRAWLENARVVIEKDAK